MSIAYSRKLDEPRLVEHFLLTVLQEEITKAKDISNLTKVEKKLSEIDFNSNNTHIDSSYRIKEYRSKARRDKLRKQIVDELYKKVRLKDDDKIKLGSGGSKPNKVKNNRIAHIIIGLPASGKSSIANKIADETGAYILDNDYAKRKIPEFNTSIGASLVHLESDFIIFGNNRMKDIILFTPLIFKCIQEGHNIVVPKIGSNAESISEFANLLKDCGYKVHLVLVNLNRKNATKRALERYKTTGRYVPLSLIFDGYANDPTITYFRLKENSKLFSSFGEVDTTTRPNAKSGTRNSIVHKKAI